jgi:hypothetical protein
MSVPSSKTTVTTDRPNFETERSSSTLGRPLMDVSTGKVMNFSISSGAKPGLLVRIWTLNVGDVGDGVDGQLLQRDATEDHHQQPSEHHQEPMIQRCVDDPARHLSGCARRPWRPSMLRP